MKVVAILLFCAAGADPRDCTPESGHHVDMQQHAVSPMECNMQSLSVLAQDPRASAEGFSKIICKRSR